MKTYFLRITLFVAASVLLFIPQTQTFALGVCRGQESATKIEEGRLIKGTIRQGAETWYFFTGEEGDIWRIEMLGDSSELFHLGLLDPESRLKPDYSNDFFFEYFIGNQQFNSAFRISSNGVYCLRISNESDARLLNYTLRLSPFTIRNGEIDNADDLDDFGTNIVGIWYYEHGNYQHALEFFIHAVELNNKDAILDSNVCSTAYTLGRYSLAIEYCTNAIELGENLVQAYSYRADAYRASGFYTEASNDYNKVINLEPDNPDRYFSLGTDYLLMDDARAASDIFAKYMRVGSVDNPFWPALASLLAGNTSDAIDNLKSSIAVLENSDDNPFYPTLWLAIALELNDGSQREIETLFNEAENYAAEFDNTLEQNQAYALLALAHGNFNEAQSYYNKLIKERPLAGDHILDLLYLSILRDTHKGDTAYDTIFKWFKSELGIVE